MPMCAAFAGTYEPICASMAISAFWRRNVDLPAMLGPVTSQMRPASPPSIGPRSDPLATNADPIGAKRLLDHGMTAVRRC